MEPFVAACGSCGTPFVAYRQTARYCGSTCRQRARRGRSGEGAAVPAAPPAEVTASAYAAAFLESVRAELEGRDDPHSLLALHLAEEYMKSTQPGARRTFAAEFVKAYKQAKPATRAPIDELRRRRQGRNNP